MRVYKLESEIEKYKSFMFSRETDFVWLKRLSGSPVTSEWPTPEVEAVAGKGRRFSLGDFPAFSVSHIPVFSKRAVDALKEVLTSNGELLALKFSEGEFFAYNVLTLAGVLDEEKSDIARFPNGRIMAVRKYALDKGKLTNQVIFKIPEIVLIAVFVTGLFKNLVEQADLTGFCFKEIE